MNAEIISVGTELLLGDILNTNTQYLSKKLRGMGINVYNHQSVGDNKERLKEALLLALSRSDVVITIAGLGPTDDDITCETVCNTLQLQMTYDPQIEQEIREYFASRDREMPEECLKQAVVPLGAQILHNKIGTAPGSIVNGENKCIIMLPGPPDELQVMFDDPQVEEKLREYSNGVIKSQTIRVIGMGESEVEKRISEFVKYENPTVATYAKAGEVEIRVTANGSDNTEVDWLIDPLVEKISAKLGYTIYGYGDTNIQTEVVKTLMAKNLKIATAESCTAGLLSKSITDVEGASAIFEMGVSTYSAEKKMQLLGVSRRTLDTQGEVSAQTSREMSVGVLQNSGADIGIGITGIAGPGGGTAQKPVGLVYISMATKEHVYTGMINIGNRDRDYIRQVAVKSALDMVRRYINGFEKTLGQPVLTSVIEKFLTKGQTTPFESQSQPDEDSVDLGYIPPAPKLTPGFEIKEDFTPDQPIIPTEDIGTAKSDSIYQPTAKGQSMADKFRESDVIIGTNANTGYIPFDPSATKQIGYSNPTAYANPTAEKSFFDKIKEKVLSILPAKKAEEAQTATAEQSEISLKSAQDLTSEKSLEDTQTATAPKEKWYKRLLFWFIPRKGEQTLSAVIKIVRLVCIIALLITIPMISSYYIDMFRYQSGNDSLVEKYDPNDLSVNQQGILNNMQQYVDMNPDAVGYLTISGIDATGPVVQGEDNDFYLDHDFFKTQTRFGARFADTNAIGLKQGNLTQNTVIYGHYSEGGEVFGDLNKYKELDFYKEHATIQFSTLYQKYDWKVVAVFITNTHEEDDAIGVFNYRINQFDNQEAFLQFVTELKHRSIINTNVDVIENDKLLTLSTCSRIFEDARFVVVARMVRKGENNAVDLSAVTENQNPLYPDIWYKIYGGVKPVFSDAGEPVTTTEPLTVATSETTTETTTESTTEATQATQTTPVEIPVVTSPPTQAPTTAPTTTQPTTEPTTAQTQTPFTTRQLPTTSTTTQNPNVYQYTAETP